MYAAVMVAFPSVTEEGSKDAINIWMDDILPVLLPFFILSDFVKRCGDLDKLPATIYPFVMAFLSGYPMGAKIVGDMVKEGALGGGEGRFVLSYSLVTGPAFILGTIGAFLGSSRAAVIVALAHYGGAVCNGWFYRFGPEQDYSAAGTVGRKENNNYLDAFTDAILAGFKAMGIILAYLIMFMIGTQLLERLGVFGLLPGEVMPDFVKGLLEMTMGANALGGCIEASMELKVVLTSFVVSFGGFSVIGQSVSMAAGSGIGLADILKIKFTHGLLAGVIAAVLVLLIL